MQEQFFRKNEGLILICQNNEDQSLVIFGANERACEITGISEDAFKGRSLEEAVPRDIRETLSDYLEYNDAGPDLADVINKVRDFRLLNADGDEVPLKVKISQAEAKDKNFWYRLILRDESYEREVDSFKRLLLENFKGHEVLDQEILLPNRDSLLKDVEIADLYVKEKGINCCFALFRLDKFEELRRTFGRTPATLVLKQVGANLKRNLRGDDTVGRASADALGLILVDITQESARVVLNRLRWLIASEPLHIHDMPQRKVSVSVAFAMLGSQPPIALVESCEDSLAKDSSPGALIEK